MGGENLLLAGKDSAGEGVVVECVMKDTATKMISATWGRVSRELWSSGVVFPGVLSSWTAKEFSPKRVWRTG